MAELDRQKNPAYKNTHPKKLEVITLLIQTTDGKPIAQSLPFLMQANQMLQAEGLSFTEEESSLIMDILTKDMNPKEKEQFNKMKAFIMSQVKK